MNDFDNIEIKKMEKLAKNKNPEIRYELAESLCGKNSKYTDKILLELLNDSDELVKISACDSAYNCNSEEILNKLKMMAEKEKYLIRGYAILSIGNIVAKYNIEKEKNTTFLENRLNREKSLWVKINIYTSLYLLGKKDYLKLLLNCIDHTNYKIRCNVINSIEELMNKDNEIIIIEALRKRMNIEKTKAVKSGIERILSR